MPKENKFYIPPVNYYAITGEKWQVTGFRIRNNHKDCEFIDHSTGLAKYLFIVCVFPQNGRKNSVYVQM